MRNNYDFYPTPPYCYEQLPIDWSLFDTAIEPCQGDGRIVEFLKNINCSEVSIDKGVTYVSCSDTIAKILEKYT